MSGRRGGRGPASRAVPGSDYGGSLPAARPCGDGASVAGGGGVIGRLLVQRMRPGPLRRVDGVCGPSNATALRAVARRSRSPTALHRVAAINSAASAVITACATAWASTSSGCPAGIPILARQVSASSPSPAGQAAPDRRRAQYRARARIAERSRCHRCGWSRSISRSCRRNPATSSASQSSRWTPCRLTYRPTTAASMGTASLRGTRAPPLAAPGSLIRVCARSATPRPRPRCRSAQTDPLTARVTVPTTRPGLPAPAVGPAAAVARPSGRTPTAPPPAATDHRPCGEAANSRLLNSCAPD